MEKGSMKNRKNEESYEEWERLIEEAKDLGLSIEEVKLFLTYPNSSLCKYIKLITHASNS